MVDVFSKLNERGGFTNPSEISGGVFQSLVTTALGLMIAIVMSVFYLYFLGRAKRLMHRLERAGIETVNMVFDARMEEEQQAREEKRKEHAL